MNIKSGVSAAIALVLVVSQFFSYPVFADEYVISGNGDGSQSTINYQQDNSTALNQSNEANINNDVASEASTGENEASSNTGEASIETGDVSESVVVENSGNFSSAQIDCCPLEDSSTIEVTNNGSDSDNSVNYTQDTTTQISQNNSLILTNNIQINASTGDNEASDNEGDVTITTGEINILAALLNENLNSSFISASVQTPQFNLKVSGNGSSSVNDINDNFESKEEFFVNNYLQLNNYINNYSNTGGNKANKNNGNVFISTGSIYLGFILSNKVNTSKIIAACCQNPVSYPSPPPSGGSAPSESPSPSESPLTSTPPSGGGGNGGGGGGGDGGSGSGSSGGDGEVLGAALPSTGGFSIWTLTFFALGLLILGIMLKLDYEKAKNYWQYFNYSFTATAVIYLLAAFKSLSLSAQTQYSRGHPLYFYPQNLRLRAFN